MRRKRIVSSIAALTMAASAFAGMAVTTSASTTYELPENMKVGDVLIGSLGEDGNVIPETFTGYDTSKWDGSFIGSGSNHSGGISIGNTTEVQKPEIGSITDSVPTYVSGDTLRFYVRQGSSSGRLYGLYDFEDISSDNANKLVFSTDVYNEYTSSQVYISFFTKGNEPSEGNRAGNPALTLNWKNGSGLQYYQYTVNGTTTGTNSNDTRSTARTYVGYGISDLEIDLKTGDVSFYLDCIADRFSNERKRTEITTNIGENPEISAIGIGRDAVSRTNIYTQLDNMELYTIVDAPSETPAPEPSETAAPQPSETATPIPEPSESPTPGTGTASAERVDNGDFEAEGAKASLWQATVKGDGETAYTAVEAKVIGIDGSEGTGTGSINTAITTGGSVFATIVVEGKAQNEISSVTVTLK